MDLKKIVSSAGSRSILAVCIIVVATFSVYLYSLCPTLYTIDSGELAAASTLLGIAHPTGYPLYTILSYLFVHLLPIEPITALNLFSALLAVTSCVFLYLTAHDILRSRIAPVLIVALYAFAPTIWKNSITNEVYPMTALFSVLLIYTLHRLKDSRTLFLLMYLIGLSLTNHMSIFALVIPLGAYLVFFQRPSRGRILISLGCVGFGMSLYFYLIARTLGGATLAWGNPVNLERLLWHITGKQYQVWMFSLSAAEIIQNARQGIMFISRDFIYVFIIPCFIGAYHLFRSDRKIFFLLLAAFLLNFLYTINYAIPDIESYYIPGLVVLMVFCIYGLKLALKYLRWYVIIPIALIIPLLNYRSATLRGNDFTLGFGLGQIEQLPDSCLLISNYWDVVSPLIYLQNVKKIRTDIVVIDKELLRRTWYLKYLDRRYPDFYRTVERPVNEYLKELVKFEYKKPYDPYTIQLKYLRMLESFVEAKQHKGVFFSLPYADQDLQQVKPQIPRTPYGLVFAVTSDTTTRFFDFSRLRIRKPPVINDSRLAFNVDFVATMAKNNVQYLNIRQQYDRAKIIAVWQNALVR